mgnify:CR=1 FL=1
MPIVERKAVSGIILILLLASMLTFTVNIKPAKSEPAAIIVPDDYPTIREAIDHASDGDTIFVRDGRYYENIHMNKSICLVGENKHGTIIDGNFTGTVVAITADNVNVSNFTICNGEPHGHGVSIEHSKDCFISNNIITNSLFGIKLSESSNNTIADNRVFCPQDWMGVTLYFSDGNTLTNNTFSSGYVGILLSSANHNTLNNNKLYSNWFGIRLANSNNNTIVANKVFNNSIGIYIASYDSPGINNLVYHNNFVNNTEQAAESNSTNIWHSGYPSGGNYWSNYNGADFYSGPFQNETGSDGIGDIPYVIDANNQDRYPLMHPWSSLSVHNMNTGLGYATIQEAINANETLNGHTIFVEAGTYYENRREIEIPVLGGKGRIIVNKTVSIVGENMDNTIIDGNGATYTIVIMASGVNIRGFSIENACYAGICLYYYIKNVTIGGNRLRNNYRGVLLTGDSGHNAIIGNEITDNMASGIDLSRSNHNIICNNKIKDNHASGIYVGLSSHNVIRANDIVNSTFGIALEEASLNTFYHNNFINNEKIQVPGYNTWDNGYPSGGNYWSDYVGVDVENGPGQDLPGSDGIGDMSCVIGPNNVDHYPLMNPYRAPPPQTYVLTITTTVGGTTDPAPGTYSYTANSTVQVVAIPEANYLFDHRELDDVNVGSANPYSVLMDKDHRLKAVFSPIPPPLSASISPLSASINVGESLTFTSTVTGGTPPYSYQWYLDGDPVSGVNESSWTFTPTASGIYYVYLKVTDAKGNATQSETARITTTAVPVGGYSLPIHVHTKATSITPYIALITILTVIFIKAKRKTKRKTK